MSRMDLIPAEGSFYKANLHTHTTLSDGALTPPAMKEAYRAEGYSIVAFTDHRLYRWHTELADEAFLPLAAFEANIDEPRPDKDYTRNKTYHINFYDTQPEQNREEKERMTMPVFPYELEAVNEYIAQMNQKGFLACYNHPYWSLQTAPEYEGLRGLFAMEILNYGCEPEGMYGYNPQAYDEMLRAGQRIFCVATDDNHNRSPQGSPLWDSFGGFTMIKAKSLCYPDVIEALQKGHFYSSMGPEILALWVEDKALHVRCSPAQSVYVVTATRKCYHINCPQGETVEEASFALDGNEGYVRVVCNAPDGRKAFSNAYFLDEMWE